MSHCAVTLNLYSVVYEQYLNKTENININIQTDRSGSRFVVPKAHEILSLRKEYKNTMYHSKYTLQKELWKGPMQLRGPDADTPMLGPPDAKS